MRCSRTDQEKASGRRGGMFVYEAEFLLEAKSKLRLQLPSASTSLLSSRLSSTMQAPVQSTF